MIPPYLIRDRNYHLTLVKQIGNMVNEGHLPRVVSVDRRAVTTGPRTMPLAVGGGRKTRASRMV